VVFVDEVPRAPNGKADYQLAKQHALDALASPVTRASPDTLAVPTT
jgi:hypothetical protein